MTNATFKKYCLVVDEWFINGFNGTKAYQKYYPNAKYSSCDATFRQILEIPRIQEYKNNLQKELAENNKISIQECVEILAKMVRFDIADLFNENGSLKSIHDIPKDTRLAILEMNSIEEFAGFGEKRELIGYNKKVKTEPRRATLIELLKHLGGYEKDNNQKKAPEFVVFDGRKIKD